MKNLIIFDMDGVIVDVSASYRDTVRKTAYLFLKDSKGGSGLREPLFTLEDLSAVKQSGGLNNDWDLSHRVLTLLMSRVETLDSTDRAEWDVSRLAEYLDASDTHLEVTLCSYSGFRSPQADFFYRNDVGSGNIIKQIFQEVYLGEELFKETYHMDCEFYKEDGFILREKLFISPDILSGWAECNTLAVATGRPRAEALYPLKKHNIDCFEKIYSLDECLEAEKEAVERGETDVSYSKPHPFMLDELADEFTAEGEEYAEYFYVGDMPDDMLAANASRHKFRGIAVLYSAPDKKGSLERLKKAGASVIAESAQELGPLFK